MGTTPLHRGFCWSAPPCFHHMLGQPYLFHSLAMSACELMLYCVPPSCSPLVSPVEAHCPGGKAEHGGGPSASESPENSEGGTNSHSWVGRGSGGFRCHLVLSHPITHTRCLSLHKNGLSSNPLTTSVLQEKQQCPTRKLVHRALLFFSFNCSHVTELLNTQSKAMQVKIFQIESLSLGA